MTNEQILKKAIEKAIKNGWTAKGVIVDKDKIKDFEPICELILREQPYFYYDHDFAKAFWKDQKESRDYISITYFFDELKAWQCYLAMMILEKEPLKYLEKFL